MKLKIYSTILFEGFANALLTLLMTSCSRLANTPTPETQTPPATQTQTTPTVSSKSGKIEFKSDGGKAAFSLKYESDGAKLVDENDRELARLTVDSREKVKIKDSADRAIGYVVTDAQSWKIKNASQNQELYVLQRQSDGDYKLKSSANQEIYRIKKRKYGFEIETPAKQSLYKIKSKDGKISLKNPSGKTVLYVKSGLTPIAIACFGFDALSREQKAALAYAVNLSVWYNTHLAK